MERLLKFGTISEIDKEMHPATNAVVGRVMELARAFKKGVKDVREDPLKSDEGREQALADLGKQFIAPVLSTVKLSGGLRQLHMELEKASKAYELARVPLDNELNDAQKLLRELRHQEIRRIFKAEHERESERGLELLRLVASGDEPEIVEAVLRSPLSMVQPQMRETALHMLAEQRDPGVTDRVIQAHTIYEALRDATASVITAISKTAKLDPSGALGEIPAIDDNLRSMLSSAFEQHAQTAA